MRVSEVVTDEREFLTRHEPGHPDADSNGMVRYPHVNTVEEMTNLLSAGRSFDANLMIISKVRSMSDAIFKVGA